MRSFYMRIFKNIICIYVLALCCFAYATMIHAIPDHVYVQEGQKLELDKKIPVTLAMSTKPQSVMAQIGERTFQAMKQERAVETCSQLKQGEYTLTCYLFGILPMKEVQVSVVNGKSLYVSGQVVGIYGAAQGVLDPAATYKIEIKPAAAGAAGASGVTVSGGTADEQKILKDAFYELNGIGAVSDLKLESKAGKAVSKIEITCQSASSTTAMVTVAVTTGTGSFDKITSK